MRQPIRARLRTVSPLLLAAAAAAAAGVAWVALAATTGLIYHLMPAAPPLAAWALLSWTGSPTTARQRLGGIALAAAISVAVALALASTGYPLDAAWLTLLPTFIGATLALLLLRSRA